MNTSVGGERKNKRGEREEGKRKRDYVSYCT